MAVLLAMVLVGLAAVVSGVVLALPIPLRLVLVAGGMVLAGWFGVLAAGARRAGVSSTSDGGIHAGAEMPADETIRTTWRKTGFPKQGNMPPKDGNMPSKGPTETSERARADRQN